MRSKVFLLETKPEDSHYDEYIFLRSLSVSLEARGEILHYRTLPQINPPGIEEANVLIKGLNLPFEKRNFRAPKDIRDAILSGRPPVLYWKDILPNWVCLFGFIETPIEKLFIGTGNPLMSFDNYEGREHTYTIPVHKLNEHIVKKDLSCSFFLPTV